MIKNKKEDSIEYLEKKAFFNKVLTIYGRNSVKEALNDKRLTIHKLHLSTSNKDALILEEMKSISQKRKIEIAYHNKSALSRISKNAKQDQGVALDIVLENFMDEKEFITKHKNYKIIALDGITNPQNLGMIIRSATAGDIDAILLPSKGTAQITPLVIQASVGTLFKLPIIATQNLSKSLQVFKDKNTTIYTLSSHAKKSYKEVVLSGKSIFVLGNETEGVSKAIEKISTSTISIPMKREVESLNVAMTATILAFL